MSRRLLKLASMWAVLALSCTVQAEPLVIEQSSTLAISQQQLLERLIDADYVLLGELHDNGAHHQERAQLIQKLAALRLAQGKQPPVLIVEHLDLGRKLEPGDSLEAQLDAAGFDRKNWRWPLHKPLFETALAARLAVYGGNLSRSMGRQVVMGGESALPAALRERIQLAPLSAAAQASLDRDLQAGHCGQMPPERLPSMRLAQRARDASLAQGLLAQGAGAVLLAGNGHVRRDYGVPILLAQAAAGARVLSVGFLEAGKSAVAASPYDYVWLSQAAEREDPCAGMKM